MTLKNVQSSDAETSRAALNLRRIARISAWLLLAAVIISLVSGWGITRTEIIYKASFGIIDRKLAKYIHRATQVPMAAVFLSHLLINIKLGLLTERVPKSWLVNALLIVVGLCLLLMVVYMEYFT